MGDSGNTLEGRFDDSDAKYVLEVRRDQLRERHPGDLITAVVQKIQPVSKGETCQE